MRCPDARGPDASGQSAGLWLEGLTVALRDGARVFRLEVEALHLPPGTVVALEGPSGSGKTLLLEILGLLRRPTRIGAFALLPEPGGVRVDLAAALTGQGRAGAARLRASHYGFVAQSGGLLPFLSLRENIALTQTLSGRPDPVWLDRLLARLGLAEVARLLPGALSIGQRQRGAIARALAHRPRIIIADEPTAALDPETADEVLRLLADIATEGGAAVLLSSHDRARTQALGLRRWQLHSARETGPDGKPAVVSRLETDR